MPQWQVHFYVTANNQNYIAEQTVSASDRTAAVRIVEAMYGGNIRLRWVDKIG